MLTEEKRIEHHHALEDFAAWLIGALKMQGVALSVSGENSLHIKGELTADQRENIRLWKRQLIENLSPKCVCCGLPMRLINDGAVWLCPFGCKSIEVKK